MNVGVSVVNATTGRPVDGLPVRLERRQLGDWQVVRSGVTDARDRIVCRSSELSALWQTRVVLETDRSYTTLGVRPFYSHIEVTFHGSETARDREIPVVISPHGYVSCAVG